MQLTHPNTKLSAEIVIIPDCNHTRIHWYIRCIKQEGFASKPRGMFICWGGRDKAGKGWGVLLVLLFIWGAVFFILFFKTKQNHILSEFVYLLWGWSSHLSVWLYKLKINWSSSFGLKTDNFLLWNASSAYLGVIFMPISQLSSPRLREVNLFTRNKIQHTNKTYKSSLLFWWNQSICWYNLSEEYST